MNNIYLGENTKYKWIKLLGNLKATESQNKAPCRVFKHVLQYIFIFEIWLYVSCFAWLLLHYLNPASKVHGANIGPIWSRQYPGEPQVGPMNLAIWEMKLLLKIIIWLHKNTN